MFFKQLATKTDVQNAVKDLQNEMKLLEQRLTIKMGTIVAAGIGIFLALEKLIK
jgi:hypothetical protein